MLHKLFFIKNGVRRTPPSQIIQRWIPLWKVSPRKILPYPFLKLILLNKCFSSRWEYYFWKRASKAKRLRDIIVPLDNFKGCGDQIFQKRTFIIVIIIFVIIIIQLLLLPLLLSKNVWACAKKVFKSGTSVSIFQRRLGCYLLYGRMEMYKWHESVYNSFLDAQIKGPNIPFNLSPPS